ncbi:UDP-glycosyltransferase UGT4-like [Rhodnius prolixus]|uniref:UDP-glucuronosyltransferase n=1 Tax=Rhodnius prolixus TaxID=13249 RepID=R4G8T3_RHOPR
MRFLLLVTLVLYCNEVEMSNILALFPLPQYSHTSNFMPIFKALASRGHNVTVVSPFPQKTPVPNLNDIVIRNDWDHIVSYFTLSDVIKMSERLFQLKFIWEVGDKLSQLALSNEYVQKLIRDKHTKFDLILLETFAFQEPLVAFGYKFNAPVINLHPCILSASASHFVGNSIPFSYSPTRFSTFSDRMTFLERVETAFFHTWDLLMYSIYHIRRQDHLMRKYLQHSELPNLPPLADMLRNTSLTLINHNSAVGYPLPLHKNVIEFGGINVKSGGKLPKDLQEIMDSAVYGVIYFNFGSIFNLSALPEETQTSIISALGKVKRRVLIKWNTLPANVKLPENIEFRKWYPQSSILAHPNCKLFITHGGVASIMEGIYHAVPLLLVPLFSDQKYNAKYAEGRGDGEVLYLEDLNEDNLFNSINRVLDNTRYKENIQKHSAIFKDQPIDTLEHVIYWIEYVIRHRGAAHLRPAVLDLYWYQYLMLDVIAFYTSIVFLILYIVKSVLCLIFRTVRRIIRKRNCEKDLNKSKKE